MPLPRSDALVLFGVTGDLAHKMIFPALYALAQRGALKVPVIGVASPKWSPTDLRNRVKDSIFKHSGGIDNQRAFEHLLSRLGYVSGDYNDRGTFTKLALTRITEACELEAQYHEQLVWGPLRDLTAATADQGAGESAW